MTAVYVIQAEGGPVKIGMAVNPQNRLLALRTGTPFPLSLTHVQDVEELDASAVERAAHVLLAAARVHGEWFSATADEAREAIAAAIEMLRAGDFAPSDEPKDVRLPVMVTRSEAEAIDDWRFKNRIATRAEALRLLIQRGLTLPVEPQPRHAEAQTS